MKIADKVLVVIALIVVATMSIWWWHAATPRSDGANPANSGAESVGGAVPSQALNLDSPQGLSQRASADVLAVQTTEGQTNAHNLAVAEPPASPGSFKAALDQSPSEELLAEARRLRDQVAAAAQPMLDDQLAKGQAEFVSTEQSYKVRKEDSSDICSMRYVPGSGMYRMVLARDAYPELYALKDQAIEMEQLVRQRNRGTRTPSTGK